MRTIQKLIFILLGFLAGCTRNISFILIKESVVVPMRQHILVDVA